MYHEAVDTPTPPTVPILDTSMEIDNTAYDTPTVNKDTVDVHNNATYGQIMEQ